MSREMYDGVDATRLPTSAQMVAGYVDGLYRWSDADWGRFPNAVKIRIAVFSQTNDGHVLDEEPGNATPAESVDWVLMRRRAGIDPTVYCNQFDPDTGWPAVRAAFLARDVPEPHYWVAHYDGIATIPAGAIGKQHTDDEPNGWDLSVIADHWPGVDPALPTPASQTLSTEELDMMHIDLEPGKRHVFVNPGAVTLKTAELLLGSDWGDAVVRVALFSFKTASWSVTPYSLGRVAGAAKIPLPPDVNKVSLTQMSGDGVVGADVLA